MIDQIKSKTINTSASDIKKSVDSTSKVKEKVKKVDNPEKAATNDFGGKVSQFITKEKIKSMSKEPPIDTATTNRIKTAIKDGNYPIDMAKVADALFDAYKEMK